MQSLRNKSIVALFLLVSSMAFFNACEYKNEEDLFLNSNKTCDTVDVSYNDVIQPIFSASCAIAGGCHDDQGASIAFGINLSSYEKTQQSGMTDGMLLDAINHTGSFPMPKGAEKLPKCEIEQIESWVRNGRKNN
ncbi:hypothetical protein [Luteibaculum oceani]|uniref:Cytochrome C Planctomycete-type domain-containing protein n=1 Tax=Luteibaculum oceani TaxID=1294296 RepID=A0A5C6V829_9FLAO|nr:hypothetical protein [Luteibaculum oceani]TXC81472.1 hypothetical protein FRX97_05560 [Luteibaculum oceani]